MDNEVNRLGNIYGFTGGSFAGMVYSTDGLSPSLNTSQGGGREPMIPEIKVCAMKGRNIDNPSDRSKGSPLEQRLEPNEQGICNTLTSVQKDNLVLQIKANTKDGYTNMTLPGLVDCAYPESETRRGRVQGGEKICPTLTTQEPEIYYVELAPPDEYTSAFTDGESIYHIRLRKLTPRECWRLMGFPDEAFDKASKVNSNTQLYKQAGNSIVVNVLMAIFGQMNLEEADA